MREPIVPQLDADEFLHWDARQRDKFELHDGFVVAFAGGTLDHSRIGLNLQNAFDRLFAAPCRSFGPDVKVRVAAATFYYADAGSVCVEMDPLATIVESPRVVAEVLSPSTRAYDLVEKRQAYRGLASVEFYVIVHTAMRRVEVDSRDARGGWATTITDDGDAYLGARPLSLSDVYARTSLEAAEP